MSGSNDAAPGFGWAARFAGDDYEWRARRAPVLLAALPLAAAALAWAPHFDWTAILPAGAGGLLLGWCGDVGRMSKERENALYESWGGKPTTRLLRHRDSPLSKQKLKSLHRKLAERTEISAPSVNREASDPMEADKIYEDYATHLRDATRDGAKFPLVRAELVNYGRARNAFGLRKIGIAASVVALSITLARLFAAWKSGVPLDVAAPCFVALFALVMLGFWLFWSRPATVRHVAEAYAARLIEAADKL